MRVILIVDLITLGSLVVGGLSFLLSSNYWRWWVLRISAAVFGLGALLWVADASGVIHLPRPHEAPAPLLNLPEHAATIPAVGPAPNITSKVQHQSVLEDRKKAQESATQPK